MKKYLERLWQKLVDNKEVVIKVVATAVMTAAGILVADAIHNAQQQDSLVEEITMESLEEDEELA
jgi:sulfur relay (sulfurtransferase) complex TusBCD TusD component (DsrE family)